jgi:beta-glucanase (GH16 family)
MRSLVSGVISSLVLSLPGAAEPEKRYLFRDETMTSTLWSSREAGNPAAVVRRDGKMVLRVRPDGTWAEMSTEDRFSFTHGWAAARVRFPANPGAHAAFWLQSAGEPYAPGESEVNVVECFGWDRVWSNVYWREPTQGAGEFMSTKRSTQIDPTVWRIYSVRWSPDRYDFFIDGVRVHTITEGLSRTPKFLVLSIRVSDYESHHLANYPRSSYKFVVDWVRVWQNANRS